MIFATAKSAIFFDTSPFFLRRSHGRLLALATSMLIDAPFNRITSDIIGSAIEVHRELGPGLLESIYLACLQLELDAVGRRWLAHCAVPVAYKGRPLALSYRVDLIVEQTVLVELKSVERLLPVHDAQTLTYMRLFDLPAGLLINFNVPKLTDGIRRLINPRRI